MKLVLVVLWFLVGISAVNAQAVQKPIVQRHIEYEVIQSDDAHVTAREGCFGLKFVTVYVVPASGTKEKVESFAKEIVASFPKEYDLMVEFTIDRYLTIESSSTDEVLYLKNLRGFYIRNRTVNVDKILIFPKGTSRDELEKLIEIEEN